MSRVERPLWAVLFVGLTQVAVLLFLLWVVHESIEDGDYPTAAVCALIFLALVIEVQEKHR